MQELIKRLAEHVASFIELVAILVVTIGTLEALAAARMIFTGRSDAARREAGDIVHTAVAPTWDDIGRVAAIAVIRTFLTYFLERDMESLRKRLEAEGGR